MTVQAVESGICMMSIQALTAVSLHIRFYNGDSFVLDVPVLVPLWSNLLGN